jgi:hypothetical protein
VISGIDGLKMAVAFPEATAIAVVPPNHRAGYSYP